jgi:DNA ligase-1
MEYITNELQTLGLKNVVLDGEVFGLDWNLSVGVAHTESDHPDKKHLKFHIFDMISFDDWKKKINHVPYIVRKEAIRKYFLKGFNNLVAAPEVVVDSKDEAFKEYEDRVKEGFEGVVLKEINSFYPFDRSEHWLKWKPFFSADVKIVGYYEGTGRNVGRLGGFTISLNNVETDCGGGFSDELRTEFWTKRVEMVGRIIEVKYQGFTKDGKLRFPDYLRLRIDKE